MGRLFSHAQEQGCSADPDPSSPSVWIGARPGPLKGAAMGLSITRYPQAPPTDPLSTIVQVELFY